MKNKRVISFILLIAILMGNLNVFFTKTYADDNIVRKETTETTEENERKESVDEELKEVPIEDGEEIEEVHKDEEEELEEVHIGDEEKVSSDLEENIPNNINEEFEMGDNLDHLDGPVEIEAPEIKYDIYPEMPFENTRVKRDLDGLAPGEVKTYKTAEPVPGKVNTWDVTVRVEGRDTEKTSDIVLVIDRSGSMKDNGRMVAAKEAARNFTNILLPGNGKTRIAVVSFADNVRVNQELTNNKNVVLRAINNLNARGGTFTQAGIRQAEAILANSDADIKNIVLLSDGVPTYSYKIHNPRTYTEWFGKTVIDIGWIFPNYVEFDAYETIKTIPKEQFDYEKTVGTGKVLRNSFEEDNENRNIYYYNHGNSAIAEAGFAKSDNYLLYTIALEVEEVGEYILNEMASPGKAYTANPEDLSTIFGEIGGEIAAAVKNGKVTDPMGQGFIVIGPAENITVSQGTYEYNEVTKTIDWNMGTLTQSIKPGSDIKYAELKYRVEIDDDILTARPDEDGRYPTNGDTILEYTNINNETNKEIFVSPKVKPTIITIEKKLIDSYGNILSGENDNRIFEITVGDSKYNLKAGDKKVLTKLEYNNNYTVSETGFTGDPAHSSEDYNTVISHESFTIRENEEFPNTDILVTNTEKSDGELTVKKVFAPISDQNRFKRNTPPIFTFELIGPIRDDGTSVLEGVEGLTKTEDGKYIFILLANTEFTFSNLSYGEYTVKEIESHGFEPTYSPENGKVSLSISNKKTEIVVTNTPKADDQYLNLTIKKVWDDENNQDGLRPKEVKIQLTADGEKVGEPIVLNNSNSWTYNWKDKLQKYKSDGSKIQYDVEELTSCVGYEDPVYKKEYNDTNTEKTITITNKHVPKTIDIEATKTWNDDNNRDKKRPESITIELYKTVGESEAKKVEGKEQVVTEKTATDLEKNIWAYSFENLPAMEDGKEILYSVREKEVDGYTPEYITGGSLINTYNPEQINVDIVKSWQDGDNQDGTRPEEVEVELYANGDLKDSVKLTAKTSWFYSWSNLPKNHEGEPINYTVKEKNVPEGYKTTQEKSPTSGLITITNTYTPKTIDISGIKTWDDNDNAEGNRPESIKVKLLADGEPVVQKEDLTNPIEVKPDKDGNWKYSWIGLPKYKNGKEIKYSVKEEEVLNYSPEYNSENYNIVNKYTPKTIDISGMKIWEDNNNQDGLRPESITVNLLADGIKLENKTLTVKEDVEGNWKYSWTGLPKYKNGKEINYTVIEEKVEGYTTSITNKENIFTIINSHTPETINISGTKTWHDNDNQDGIRPKEIAVLLLDGNAIKVERDDNPAIVRPDEEGNWKYSWEGLPKYKNGREIGYSLAEVRIEGYTYTVDKFNLTNYHIPETVNIKLTKEWLGGPTKKPDITFKLNKQVEGGEITEVPDSQKVLTEGNSELIWTKLPKNEKGKEIKYTIVEGKIDNYTSVIKEVENTDNVNEKNFTVTNTYTSPQGEFTATKVWDGDEEVIRPEMEFTLYRKVGEGTEELVTGADVKKVDGTTLTAKWDNLDKTDSNGNEYTYFVKEDFANKDENTNENWTLGEYNFTDNTITNTVRKGDGKLTINKVLNNELETARAKRSISAQAVFEVKVTGPYGYEKTVDIKAGEKVELTGLYYGEYTITETNANGYVATYKVGEADATTAPAKIVLTNKTEQGTENEAKVTVINSRAGGTEDPNEVKVTINKVWEGGKETDTTINLLRKVVVEENGQEKEMLDEDFKEEFKVTKDKTSETFKDLAKHDKEGREYQYYVEESTVPENYTATISPEGAVTGKDLNFTVTNTYSSPEEPSEPSVIPPPTIKEITLVGGRATLTENVERQLADFVQYRLSGKDRYGTSVDVAKEYSKSNIVLLASGEKYTDELTATVLANKLGAPIMLTRKDAVPAEVKAEINRLGATKVILIGGNASISEKLEKELANYTVERIGGPDRYDTAILVGNQVRNLTASKTEAILVDGTNFPDAIAMTSMGVEEDMPILLTKPGQLPASTAKTIEDWNLTKVTIGGGSKSVSETVANEVKKFAEVNRIAGADRYETSVLVAEQVYVKPKHVVIASGEVFPDAIVGAPYAAKKGYPIVLSRSNNISDVAMEYILGNR